MEARDTVTKNSPLLRAPDLVVNVQDVEAEGAKHCWICHGGETSPGGAALVGNICACKNAVVHPSCLKTWILYSESRRNGEKPACEVCTEEYAFRFDMDSVAPSRECRQSRSKFVFPFKEAALPAMVGFVYGFSHDPFGCPDSFATTMAGNAAVVAVWLSCVVAASRVHSEARDVAALVCVYVAVLAGWAFQKVAMPGAPSSVSQNNIMHVANAATLTVCAAGRYAYAAVVR